MTLMMTMAMMTMSMMTMMKTTTTIDDNDAGNNLINGDYDQSPHFYSKWVIMTLCNSSTPPTISNEHNLSMMSMMATMMMILQ